MVYFKLEFGFHLPGRKHRAENKTNSKAQPAWDFISKEIECAMARKCYKTAANYRTAANSLTLFWQRDDWTMADILPQEMERYQRWLIDRGLCMNTISCYMRSLRTLYNRCSLADDCRHATFPQSVHWEGTYSQAQCTRRGHSAPEQPQSR